MGVAPAQANGPVGSEPEPGAWRGIGLPLLVVPVSLVIAVLTIGLLDALGAGEELQTTIALVVAGLVLLLLAVALWRQLPAVKRRTMIAGSSGGPAADIGVGIAAALGLVVTAGLVMLAGIAIDDSVQRRIDDAQPSLPDAAWQIALLAIGLVVLAPLGEELLFRGLLLDGFRRRVAFPAAAGITGVLFAAAHLDAWLIWPRAIALALIGFLLAELYRRRGFLTVITAHAGLNAVALTALVAS